jgi:hypothetical protein
VLGGVPGLSSNDADKQQPARDCTPEQIAMDFPEALAGVTDGHDDHPRIAW